MFYRVFKTFKMLFLSLKTIILSIIISKNESQIILNKEYIKNTLMQSKELLYLNRSVFGLIIKIFSKRRLLCTYFWSSLYSLRSVVEGSQEVFDILLMDTITDTYICLAAIIRWDIITVVMDMSVIPIISRYRNHNLFWRRRRENEKKETKFGLYLKIKSSFTFFHRRLNWPKF
jgi:hypothetical protein